MPKPQQVMNEAELTARERILREDVNHTELLAFAQGWVEIPGVSKALTREQLLEAIFSLTEAPIENPVNVLRNKTSSFIRRYWDVKFRMQCPRDIFQLLEWYDSQAAWWFLENKDQMT